MTVFPATGYGVDGPETVAREILEERDVKVAMANVADLLCSSIASRQLPDDVSVFRLAELEAHILDRLQEATLNITVEGV